MGGNALSGELPEEIGKLKLLEDFNLEDNVIIKLPKSLCKGDCESLKGLFLQNNKLSALGFKPKLLPQLRKMSLGNNAFSAQEKAQLEADAKEAGVELAGNN